MEKREFEYYAFISYCRSDEKWAKWLQHKLETYRFPTALRKEYQSLPRKIFPIFRDKTDLSSGILWEQLKYQLEESEYLIVICSPESARAEWVGREITYFQELGRGKNIIPLIIDGEPHAVDNTRECYNTALLNDTDEELLGVSVSELGRNKAALRIIASMMHLRYDQLVMRDTWRTRRRRTVAAGVFFTLLAVSACVAWYEIPHNTYYWSYVYKDELPVGLVKISKEERKTAHSYYKITTHRNKIIKLEKINSAGTVANSEITFAMDEYPIIEFAYHDNGNLYSVTQKAGNSETKLKKTYSENFKAVDFKNPSDDASVGVLPLDLSVNVGLSETDLSEKSEITRQRQEYDENGYLIKKLYKRDNLDTPTCDKNGIYGKEYVRDEEDGKILRIINLGKDEKPLQMQYSGNSTSVAFTDYEYDDYGRVISLSVYDIDEQPTLDENGVFRTKYEYDDYGCITHVRHFDDNGNPAIDNNAVSEYVLGYSSQGFLGEVYFLDANGNAAYDKKSGVHRMVSQTDKNGRQVGVSYYDADGSLVISSEGYARMSGKYDEKGRPVELWFYDCDGELTYTPDLFNAAGGTIKFDEADNMITYTFYDKTGNIALNKDGYAKICLKYDGRGLLCEELYYDAEGNPIRSCNNVASVMYEYDSIENVTSISYFDENGKPCSNSEGAAVKKYEYEGGNKVSERYYDAEGNPCYVCDEGESYAGWEAKYNDYGQMTSIRYYDKDNGGQDRPLFIKGAYEIKMEYDDRGNIIRSTYCDYNGGLMNNAEGYAVREREYNQAGETVAGLDKDENDSVVGKYWGEYDERGNLIYQVIYAYDKDGSVTCTVIFREYDEKGNLICEYDQDESGNLKVDDDGYAIYKIKYDEKNRETSIDCYNDSGEYARSVEIVYDERNNVSEQLFYDVVAQGDNLTKSLSSKLVYTYDDYGNQTEIREYDINGKIVSTNGSVAYTSKTYNVMGRPIREVFYDSNEQQTTNSFGYSITEIDYDAMGNITQCYFYDEECNLMTQESGCPAVIAKKWNELGQLKEDILYDEAGNMTSRTVYETYDKSGVCTVMRYYDAQDQLVDTYIRVAYIKEVSKNSQADKARMRANDIIIKYGDWSFFDYVSYQNTDFGELYGMISATENDTKTLLVLCRLKNNSHYFYFNEKDFEGVTGIQVEDIFLSIENVDKLKEWYESWSK